MSKTTNEGLTRSGTGCFVRQRVNIYTEICQNDYVVCNLFSYLTATRLLTA